MALSERLALILDINGAQAVSELNRVGTAADRELGKAENSTKRMGAKFESVGVGMVATAATIGVGLYSAGKGAAQLEQAIGGTEAVFEGSSVVIDTWAKGADTAAGLSEQAARQLTTRLGGALQGLGFEQDKAAEKSIELTQIGADLAATYGGTTADAVEALGSALRGEFDPMEQFNVFMKQSEIDAKAVELGLAKNTTEVDKNARAQATLAIITEQSGAAQGQFARETDTAAGQMAVMEAQVQNSKDAIGAGMLPVMAQLSGVLGGVATKFTEMDSEMGGSLSTAATWGTVALGAAGSISYLGGKTSSMSKAIKDSPVSGGSFAGGLAGVTAAAALTAAGIGMVTASVADMDARVAELSDKMSVKRESITSWADLTSTIDATSKASGDLIREAQAIRSPFEVDLAAEYAKGGVAAADAAVELQKLRIETANYARENGVSLDVATQEVQAKRAAEQATKDKAAAEAEATAGMTDAERAQYEMNEAVKASEAAYKEAADALDKFWNPAFDLADAEQAALQAHQDLTNDIMENGVSLDNNTAAGRANRQEFRDGAQAALDYGLEILKSGGSVDEATAATAGHIDQLRAQMTQAGFTKDEVDLYVAALKLTPLDILSQFSTPGLSTAIEDSQTFISLLNIIRGLKAATGLASVVQEVANAGRASGGSTMPNAVHPVGERGSEVVSTASGSVLVMGNEGGSVRPVGNMGSGAQEIVIHNYLQVDGQTLATVMNRYNMAVA